MSTIVELAGVLSTVPGIVGFLGYIVTGRRWAVEEAFHAGKGLTALDEHQVRRWTSWRRWTVLTMLAHAFLAVTAATSTTSSSPTATLIAG